MAAAALSLENIRDVLDLPEKKLPPLRVLQIVQPQQERKEEPENVHPRPLTERPKSSAKQPVKVTDASGREMVFENMRAAFIQLRLPVNKQVRTRLACLDGPTHLKLGAYGMVTYTFEFVSLD
ncbi:hypothetical protein [Paraburkholderia graminis]|uniref:hypothetical protein n=1 Tax=Paraburkholderia graminis TaxID=60548 RepID=UPI0038B7E22B